MKFSINREQFLDELGLIKNVVEKSSSARGLSGVLIESKDGKVKLTGTNMDITMSSLVDATIEEEGSMCVNATKLFEIVRLFPDRPVVIERQKNDWGKIVCSGSTYKVAGSDPESFPAVESPGESLVSVSNKLICDMVATAGFALSEEDNVNLSLNGAKLIVEGDKSYCVSTDGRRLSYIEAELDHTFANILNVIVPKKALYQLLKLQSNRDEEVRIGESGNNLFFQVGDRVMVARKLTLGFPDYTALVTSQGEGCASFDAKSFHSAFARISLVTDAGTSAVKLSLKSGSAILSARNPEEGIGEEVLDADYEGKDIEFGLNHKYVLDFLRSLKIKDGETLNFNFTDEKSWVEFSLEGRGEYATKYIVAPMIL